METGDAYEELRDHDSRFRKGRGTLYVESIAIKPEARSLRTFLKLLNDCGYNKMVFDDM